MNRRLCGDPENQRDPGVHRGLIFQGLLRSGSGGHGAGAASGAASTASTTAGDGVHLAVGSGGVDREHRKLPTGVAITLRAGGLIVHLAHRPQSVEPVAACGARVLVNGHLPFLIRISHLF